MLSSASTFDVSICGEEPFKLHSALRGSTGMQPFVYLHEFNDTCSKSSVSTSDSQNSGAKCSLDSGDCWSALLFPLTLIARIFMSRVQFLSLQGLLKPLTIGGSVNRGNYSSLSQELSWG